MERAGVVTAERLRWVMAYDPATGLFRWQEAIGQRVVVGSVAGRLDRKGYRRIKIDRKYYAAHRLAWLYMTGGWPTEQIDHRNRVRDDNRWDNLREATRSQNGANLISARARTGRLKGAHPTRNGRWQASIGGGRKIIYLGRFDTEEEAHQVYAAAARERYGEFARPS